MGNQQLAGWKQIGSRTYRHQSGGRVACLHGRWQARTASATSTTVHITLGEAISHLEQSDPMFWSCEEIGAWAPLEDMSVSWGYAAGSKERYTFIAHTQEGEELPSYFASVFKRHLPENASCARCGQPFHQLSFRSLIECNGLFNSTRGDMRSFVTCVCGWPTWSMPSDLFFAFDNAINRARISWRRRQLLLENGGKHNAEEIAAILLSQGHRCIYCNLLFDDQIRPSRDHLLPVTHGGPSCAWNIIMACRSCNSRRGNIPFRTYCKTLSPTQNRRVIAHLRKRILAIDFDTVDREALLWFHYGLNLHEPRHPRYKLILSTNSKARRYAAINRILPGSSVGILRQ